MTRRTLPAYAASFSLGFREMLGSRGEMIGALVIYGVLLVIFNAIYAAMPLAELGVAGLTHNHLMWYFAAVECVIVSAPGFAVFGQMIADGRLTELMQRPSSITGMIVARLLGAHLAQAGMLTGVALAVVPLLTGAGPTIALSHVPFFFLSMLMGMLLINFFCYAVGTLEVLGPYSRGMGWLVSKFIFAFGGLLFPVSYFPPLMQKIVWLTPFPSILFTPGSFMLMPGAWAKYMGLQVFWLVVIGLLTGLASRRMQRYVLERGE